LFDFIDDSTFEYRTEGHFGRTRTKGGYIIINDTIRLRAFPKERQSDVHYFKQMGVLIIKNDSCLREVDSSDSYCKMTWDGICHPGSRK
jgi:hypothetical protein